MKRASIRRSITLGLLVLLAVTLAAGPATAKKAPKILVLSAEQMTPALLALSDMPTGWSAIPVAPLSVPNAVSGYCGGPNLAARAQDAGVVGRAQTAFTEDPTRGPTVSEQIFSFPTVNAARSFIAATSAQTRRCPSFDTAGDFAGQVYRVAPAELSFPKLADEGLAIRETTTSVVNGTSVGVTRVSDLAYTRKGNHVMLVGRGGSGADPSQLQTYAQKALTKFGVVLQAAAKKK